MGVCFAAVRVADEKIDKILADPKLVWRILKSGESEPQVEKKTSLLERIFRIKKEPLPTDVPTFQFMGGEMDVVDIDKSWEGIQYCLIQTENDPLLEFMSSGGTEVGDIESGQNATSRVFRSAEVNEIYQKIKDFDEDDIKRFFNPAGQQTDILPSELDTEDSENIDYLVINFFAFKKFLSVSVERGFGILVHFD